MSINFIQVIDVLGTLAFAISGASSAIYKKLDIFGVIIIAFVTAIGGGTLRDLLIGNTPVTWLKNDITIYVILLSTVITIFFGNYLKQFSNTLFLFDSLGLGLFTLIGIQNGVEAGFSTGICIALGTITACFGGVIRDTLLNNIPVIFHKEIYASACIIGGILYFLMNYMHVNETTAQITSIIAIVIIRILAVKYKLELPLFYKSKSK